MGMYTKKNSLTPSPSARFHARYWIPTWLPTFHITTHDTVGGLAGLFCCNWDLQLQGKLKNTVDIWNAKPPNNIQSARFLYHRRRPCPSMPPQRSWSQRTLVLFPCPKRQISPGPWEVAQGDPMKSWRSPGDIKHKLYTKVAQSGVQKFKTNSLRNGGIILVWRSYLDFGRALYSTSIWIT